MALTLEEANAIVIHRHDPDGLYRPLGSQEDGLRYQVSSEWTPRPRIFDFTQYPSSSEIIGLINGPDDINYFKADREILRHPAGIRSVVIVGSSGAGKSFIYNSARRVAGSAGFERLRTFGRFVTRRGRLETDREDGNIPVEAEVFQRMIRDKELRMWWTRDLGRGKPDFYGIPLISEQGDIPDSGCVLLFPGNNALTYSETRVEPTDSLANSLYVSVARPSEEERLSAYSHRPNSAGGIEQANRLADLQGVSALYSDLVLLNDGKTDTAWRYFQKILGVINRAVVMQDQPGHKL